MKIFDRVHPAPGSQICSIRGGVRNPHGLANLARRPELKELGWDRTMLLDLMQSLNKVVKNFEQLLRSPEPFEFTFNFHLNDPYRQVLNINEMSEEIDVFLGLGPKKVLEEAPMRLAQSMIDKCFNVSFDGAMMFDPDMFESAAHNLYSHYRQERGIMLEKEYFENKVAGIMEKYLLDLIRRKIFALILKTPLLIQKQIVRDIEDEIETYNRILKQVRITEEELPIWETIAGFAMFAAIAQREGASPASFRARSFISDELGMELASYELMFLGFTDIALKESEKKKGVQAFNLVFNNFEMLFKTFYDNVEKMID